MATRDPQRFQAECVEAFVASRIAESTIANDVGALERMLAALGRSAWEVTGRGREPGSERAGQLRAIGVSSTDLYTSRATQSHRRPTHRDLVRLPLSKGSIDHCGPPKS
jgi:hypothetical protein